MSPTTADQAAARVAASRAALLQAMRGRGRGRERGSSSSTASTSSAGFQAPQMPIAWRLAGAAASGTVSTVARRHPWLLVGAAAVIGGLIVTPYPWRWALRPPLVIGLLARLAWKTWLSRNSRPGH